MQSKLKINFGKILKEKDNLMKLMLNKIPRVWMKKKISKYIPQNNLCVMSRKVYNTEHLDDIY